MYKGLGKNGQLIIGIGIIPWFNVLNKFIGSIILIVLATFIWQQHLIKIDSEFQILAKPRPFDIYLLDHSKFNQETDYRKEFVVAKVVSVSEKEVSILISNYAYQHKNQVIKAIQLDTLLFDSFYGIKPKTISRNKLKLLRDQDTIYRALRPENLSLFGGLVMMPQKPAVLYKGFKPHPINQQAVASYQDGFFKEAFELFSQAAEQGDPWAQINLGQMYRDGEGHEVNTRRALNLFKQAKMSGNKKAEYEYQQLCQQVKDCSPSLKGDHF